LEGQDSQTKILINKENTDL